MNVSNENIIPIDTSEVIDELSEKSINSRQLSPENSGPNSPDSIGIVTPQSYQLITNNSPVQQMSPSHNENTSSSSDNHLNNNLTNYYRNELTSTDTKSTINQSITAPKKSFRIDALLGENNRINDKNMMDNRISNYPSVLNNHRKDYRGESTPSPDRLSR